MNWDPMMPSDDWDKTPAEIAAAAASRHRRRSVDANDMLLEDPSGQSIRDAISSAEREPGEIIASPFVYRPPSLIPVRPWVLGRWLLRGTVCCIVAPGAAGKSTFVAGLALSLVTAQPLLGKAVRGGPKRVWLWNLEDDLDELHRAIGAACIHHDIDGHELEGPLFLDSGMEGATLCTATEEGILKPIYAAMVHEILRREVDVLIVDPFVSSHQVEENSNGMIDAVAKAWARVAKSANCVVVLVHHTSKVGSHEVTALSSRGASALVNAARSTLVLNRMDVDTAKQLGVPDDERHRYLSVGDDKANRAPREKADWFELRGIDLGNGHGEPSDNVAVSLPWTPPDPFADVTTHHLAEVQRKIADGEWRENVQAAQWAGHVVADVLGLNAVRDRDRVKTVLREWISNGALATDRRKDGHGMEKTFVIVGRPVAA